VLAITHLQLELAGLEYREFDVAALNALRNADWPGDLAQLDTVIRNLLQTSLGEKIGLDDIKRVLHQFDGRQAMDSGTTITELSVALQVSSEQSIGLSLDSSLLDQPMRMPKLRLNPIMR